MTSLHELFMLLPRVHSALSVLLLCQTGMVPASPSFPSPERSLQSPCLPWNVLESALCIMKHFVAVAGLSPCCHSSCYLYEQSIASQQWSRSLATRLSNPKCSLRQLQLYSIQQGTRPYTARRRGRGPSNICCSYQALDGCTVQQATDGNVKPILSLWEVSNLWLNANLRDK